MSNSNDCFLLLHNIRSVQNVGAIFRTADATGVTKIYLTGYTPTPLDRFGRKRKDFVKASLGAEDFVQWEAQTDILELLKRFKMEGVQIVALEQSPRSIEYKKFVPDFPAALILGNETEGISEEVLKECAAVVELSMKGGKESLNVSVAAGVVLYWLLDSDTPTTEPS